MAENRDIYKIFIIIVDVVLAIILIYSTYLAVTSNSFMDRLWVHFGYILYSPSSTYYVTNNSILCLVHSFLIVFVIQGIIGALKKDEWLTYEN
jgi:hypothetical protein